MAILELAFSESNLYLSILGTTTGKGEVGNMPGDLGLRQEDEPEGLSKVTIEDLLFFSVLATDVGGLLAEKSKSVSPPIEAINPTTDRLLLKLGDLIPPLGDARLAPPLGDVRIGPPLGEVKGASEG